MKKETQLWLNFENNALYPVKTTLRQRRARTKEIQNSIETITNQAPKNDDKKTKYIPFLRQIEEIDTPDYHLTPKDMAYLLSNNFPKKFPQSEYFGEDKRLIAPEEDVKRAYFSVRKYARKLFE